jgi:MFS family permease
MTAVEPPASLQPPARSRGFMIGYGLAQAGAFISFIPLLTLLLPEKAQAIAGEAGAALLLSQTAIWGGATAAIANLLFGALSDRTGGRFGRRRPWIIGGVLALALSFVLLTIADTPAALIGGVIVFQLAVNAFFAPLNALVPDMVPDRQKGLASAWAGIAAPAANLFTAVVVARFYPQIGLQFALVVLATAGLLLPFVIRLREAPRAQRAFTLSFRALKDRTFALVFTSRLLAETAIAIHTLYLFLWIGGARPGTSPTGHGDATVFGWLLIVATVAAVVLGFIGGVASDRLGRRLPFVVGALLTMALALAILCAAPPWPGLLIVQLLFGGAHGLHATTVAALTAEILPDPDAFGRDIGVMNVAIAVAQSLAPAAALAMLSTGLSLVAVFFLAGVCAALAAAVLSLAKRTRAAA